MKNKTITREALSKKLVENYRLFDEGCMWLDAYGESSGTCIVACHTYLNITLKKCKQIAKFIKQLIPHEKFNYIYVGPFHFKADEL